MKILAQYTLMAAAVAGLTVSSAMAGAPAPQPTPPNTVTSKFKPGPPWGTNGEVTITDTSGTVVVWHQDPGSPVVTGVATEPGGGVVIVTYSGPPSQGGTITTKRLAPLPPVQGENKSW